MNGARINTVFYVFLTIKGKVGVNSQQRNGLAYSEFAFYDLSRDDIQLSASLQEQRIGIVWMCYGLVHRALNHRVPCERGSNPYHSTTAFDKTLFYICHVT